GTRGPAPPLDSIGMLWFDSLADYRERLYDSAAGERTIAADVASFLSAADAYATTEHVQRAPAGPPSVGATAGVKLVVALAHAPGRFSIRVGDAEAFLVYERRDDVFDVLHTYTPPALRGGNLAAELTRAALDHARAEGLRVVPTCSYTRRYLARHPA